MIDKPLLKEISCLFEKLFYLFFFFVGFIFHAMNFNFLNSNLFLYVSKTSYLDIISVYIGVCLQLLRVSYMYAKLAILKSK